MDEFCYFHGVNCVGDEQLIESKGVNQVMKSLELLLLGSVYIDVEGSRGKPRDRSHSLPLSPEIQYP